MVCWLSSMAWVLQSINKNSLTGVLDQDSMSHLFLLHPNNTSRNLHVKSLALNASQIISNAMRTAGTIDNPEYSMGPGSVVLLLRAVSCFILVS
jgi:hypothetical protein